MTTTLKPIDSAGAYRFCAKMIDKAVKDIKTGAVPEQQSAAAFLRGDRCKWMCRVVGATPQDIAKHRLDGADLNNLVFKKKTPYRRCSPATMILWDGREQTIAEWAEEKGIDKNCLRNRINKYGIIKEVFWNKRLSKQMMEAVLCRHREAVKCREHTEDSQ